MSGFFSYDSKFTTVMNKIVDIVVTSFLWLVFCIPVFTIGASTTALFTVIRQVIRQERGYVFRNFWGAFKLNFKQATGIWMLLLLIYVILGADRYIMLHYFLPQGSPFGVLHIFFTFMIIYETIWAVYIFAYISRFELDWKHVLKNAAILSVTNLPWSALMIGMVILAAFLIRYILPALIFVLPAAFGWIFSIILERIFRKYMTPEDLKKIEEEEAALKENGGRR